MQQFVQCSVLAVFVKAYFLSLCRKNIISILLKFYPNDETEKFSDFAYHADQLVPPAC
jgi:hypothetical protein